MQFLQQLLKILDTSMVKPTPYGWFHIISLVLTALIIAWLCLKHKGDSPKQVIHVVFFTALVVALMEVYKQINYSFSYEDGTAFDYQWYAFPWQFCSTPMYIGLLAGIFRKGKFHDALCAYLATYAVFAGLCVMFYPVDIYIDTIGINIQTTVCHCSMIVIGAYLFATGHVKMECKTILKAIPVFAVMVGIAAILNEHAYQVGIVPEETFNMFFVSPHCEPSLPLYSLVQGVVPFPLSLIIYIAGFSIAAFLMLLIAIGAHRLAAKKVSV